MKRLFVGTVPPKNSEEVIGRYSPTKKIVKRLLVGTVPQKGKRLLVGTVPGKKSSQEVIIRNSPKKKGRGYW